jgi:hypothetical protein
MSLHSDIRSRLGEREFSDYPVFTESESSERGELLVRALIAAAGFLAVAAAVAVVIR